MFQRTNPCKKYIYMLHIYILTYFTNYSGSEVKIRKIPAKEFIVFKKFQQIKGVNMLAVI